MQNKEYKERVIRRLIEEWVPQHQGKHVCQCGCGAVLTIHWHHHYSGIPKFAPGHRAPETRLVDPQVRFWKLVDKDGPTPSHCPELGPCWVWTGAKTGRQQKYGKFYPSKGKYILAHRYSWGMANGDAGDLDVCHRCDNPPCVNPAHLFLGTQFDNNQDRSLKGRSARGERAGSSKLTEADVIELRRRYWGDGVDPESSRRLARQFGIGSRTVINVCTPGGDWAHLPYPERKIAVHKAFLESVGGRHQIEDLTDRKFGCLTAVRFSHNEKNRAAHWVFRCDCGNVVTKRGKHLAANPPIYCSRQCPLRSRQNG